MKTQNLVSRLSLEYAISKKFAGDNLELCVWRNGRELTLNVEVFFPAKN